MWINFEEEQKVQNKKIHKLNFFEKHPSLDNFTYYN